MTRRSQLRRFFDSHARLASRFRNSWFRNGGFRNSGWHVVSEAEPLAPIPWMAVVHVPDKSVEPAAFSYVERRRPQSSHWSTKTVGCTVIGWGSLVSCLRNCGPYL